MDMTQNDSLWPLKGNFPGKTKNNRSIWICLKYNLSTSLLSTWMTYLKNILNGPGLIQGVKWWIWPKIIHFDRIRVIFLKTKNNRSIWICLKYYISTSFLSTLTTYVKNMSNWPDPGDQMMDMTQNDSLWPLKGNFPGKTKNNRSIWICLKYNLSTSLFSSLFSVSYRCTIHSLCY